MSRRDGLRPDLALVADQIFDGSRVLDLGCGEGVLLEHLIATRGCRGTGVEIDADAMLVAIRRGVPVIERDIDVALADIADDSYDTVVLSRTLQAALQPVGKEAHRGQGGHGQGHGPEHQAQPARAQIAQQGADEIHAVCAACQGQFGFCAVFGGQLVHALRVHIGRVAED